MSYFKPKSFLLSLRNRLLGKYQMEKVSKRSENLRYKISVSSEDYAFLSFEVKEGKVEVGLDFNSTASVSFIDELSDIVQVVLSSGYGGTGKRRR